MNRDTIYVAIHTHLFIHARLNQLFTEALEKFDNLAVESGPLPGLPTYAGEPWQPAVMRFIMTEHMLSRPFRLDESQPEISSDIRPVVPDSPLPHQINIAIIGAVHAGKTAIVRALEKALLGDEVKPEHIERYSLDGVAGDPVLTPEQEQECIERMHARRVVLLFPKLRRTTSCDALMTRSGLGTTIPQQS